MRMYKIGEFADKIGVSIGTLRLWDKTGELKPAHITDGGTRYYSEAQVNSYLGTSHEYLARVANELIENILIISDKSNDVGSREASTTVIHDLLLELLDFDDLDYLTSIYRDTKPTTSVNVGFDHSAVAKFVNRLNTEYGRDVVDHVIDPRVNSMEKLFGISSDDISVPYSKTATSYGYLLADMMVMSEKLHNRHDTYTKSGMSDIAAWSAVEYDIYQSFDGDMVTDSMSIIQLALSIAKLDINTTDMSIANIPIVLLNQAIESWD